MLSKNESVWDVGATPTSLPGPEQEKIHVYERGLKPCRDRRGGFAAGADLAARQSGWLKRGVCATRSSPKCAS